MGFSTRFVTIFLAVFGIAAFVVAASLDPARKADAPASIEAAIEPAAEVVETPEERAFEQKLEEIGAGLSGQLGIAVVDVRSGRSYDFNGDDQLPQQSVSKLWVAMAALGQVDDGELDLSEPVTIRRADLTLFYQPIREIVRARGSFSSDYADLMERAIARSDNSANDRLLRRVGGAAAVQEWLDEKGLLGIRFGADERTKQSAIAGLQWRQTYSYRNLFYEARDRVPDDVRRGAFEGYLADPIDGASPLAIARALTLLARGELLSQSSTERLRSILATTKSGPRRLKGGLAEGWRIEHKTGTGQVYGSEQSGYNDVGVLISPEGSEYAVAVMIGRTAKPVPARMDMMQAVTRAVIEFDERRSAPAKLAAS
ncbi:serine hydrolase [Erythrobacter sp. MTPC3]|uniref:serine hydrolase n=1 Tax=Erythrobacter sp. MTPC3 TaxID=3056564 RepID=UPI0036F357DE